MIKLIYFLIAIAALVSSDEFKLCDFSGEDELCFSPVNCITLVEGVCAPHKDCDQSGLCWGKLSQINSTWVLSENYLSEDCVDSDFTLELPIDRCYEVDVFGTKYRALISGTCSTSGNSTLKCEQWIMLMFIPIALLYRFISF